MVVRRIRFAVNLMLAGLTAVCLAAPIGYAQDMSPLSNSIRNMAVKSAPVSAELAPRAGFSAALQMARGGSGSVTLTVEGVEGTCSQPVRLNIFLNRPDAGLATPIDDTNFIGFLYLIPRRGQIGRASQAFDLSSVPNLDERRLTVTLVPVAGESETPKDLSLVIARIYLQREQ
jgi:hypothetical protein